MMIVTGRRQYQLQRKLSWENITIYLVSTNGTYVEIVTLKMLT